MLWLLAGMAIGADWPDVDQPLRTGAAAGDDAAVVIGIENYPFLTDVPYAARDAEAFSEYLVYTRGVPLRRIQSLEGGDRDQMEDALEKAAADVGKDGVLWVYFAGHGGGDPATGERLLVGDTAKADGAAFARGSISVEEVKRIATAGAAEVVLVVDACYNGLGRGGEQLGKQRFAVPSYVVDAHPQVTEWFAAGPTELANPLEAVQHGVFTYFMVGALRGWADGELGAADGKVTLEEAEAYVKRSLKEVGQRGQTPSLVPGGLQVLTVGDGLEEAPDLASLVHGSASSGGGNKPNFGVNVDVDAALKSQACAQDAQVRGLADREKRLADKVSVAVEDAEATWVKLKEQSLKCGRLQDAAVRQTCREKVESYVDWADALVVEEPAGFEVVDTECGERKVAVPAERREVATSADDARAFLAKYAEDDRMWDNPGALDRPTLDLDDSDAARSAVESAWSDCVGGEMFRCADLGWHFETARGVFRDYDRAAALYRESCGLGAQRGCAGLAYLHQHHRGGVERDYRRSLELADAACKAEDARGCYTLGLIHSRGRGVPRNPEIAKSLYVRACDDGWATGCTNLGAVSELSGEDGYPFYQRACELGDPIGCSNVALAIEHGFAGPDAGAALERYEHACSLEASGCVYLGEYLAGGAEEARAMGVYKETCTRELHGAACLAAIADLSGPVAMEVATMACENGVRELCTKLGALTRGAGDHDASFTWLERACELGDPLGCTNLGYRYSLGKGVGRDERKARALYEQACDAQEMNGCNNLAYYFSGGRGGPQDDARAVELHREACDGGYAEACQALKKRGLQP